jgi:FAD/FMN-containing dehydrogenase
VAILGGRGAQLNPQRAGLDPGWHPDNLGGSLLLAPATVEETAAIMRLCHAAGVAVIPQGGRTGLVGGAVSGLGQVIVSTQRLDRCLDIDPIDRVAIVDAGVSLQRLQEAAAQHGLEPGIDLAARGSASVGGMVATNAGGVMAFRHGVMRHRVLGLQAVLADGRIFEDMTRVVKATTGYDAKQLFIGSEGTLGLITRVALKLASRPRATSLALIGLPGIEAALRMVQHIGTCGLQLRAAEVMWQSFVAVTAAANAIDDPALGLDCAVQLILEVEGVDAARLSEDFEQELSAILPEVAASHAVIAQSARQRDDIWKLREDTAAIYRRHPSAPSYDVSVPPHAIATYVDRIRPALRALDADLAPFIFGHIADGNLHIILNCSPLSSEREQAVESILYDGLTEIGGAFAAEHGIGLKRRAALELFGPSTKVAVMASLKATLDPGNILNPGKIVDLKTKD